MHNRETPQSILGPFSGNSSQNHIQITFDFKELVLCFGEMDSEERETSEINDEGEHHHVSRDESTKHEYFERKGGYLTLFNVHRLLITTVMVAAKFVDDGCYSNGHYARVGGVSTAEMNRMELELLFSLDFRLFVTTELFCSYYGDARISLNYRELTMEAYMLSSPSSFPPSHSQPDKEYRDCSSPSPSGQIKVYPQIEMTALSFKSITPSAR
ncbi:hypothetical protein K1719_024901 [Acacia pycnantha]|nr:hypothetical protein K1719_024901 [Acacia pycnantha]